MSEPDRFESLLRRYPASWRDRYGDELAALLEDTYGDGPVPLLQRASLFRGGLVEQLRASGLSPQAGPSARVRSGALVVLCAWAVFMMTGSAFAKYLEHWDLATPPSARRLPADAVITVTVASVLAVALVATGALLLLPPLVRSVRTKGWGALGRITGAAGLLVVVAVAATGGAILLAHSRSATGHSGGSWGYAAGAAWSLVLLAALVACTRAAVAAAGRVELRGALLRAEAACALGVFMCMVIVLAGTATWWGAVALRAPRFLGTSLGPIGTWGSVAPPVMVGITGVMLVALLAAAAGALRILGGLRVAG